MSNISKTTPKILEHYGFKREDTGVYEKSSKDGIYYFQTNVESSTTTIIITEERSKNIDKHISETFDINCGYWDDITKIKEESERAIAVSGRFSGLKQRFIKSIFSNN